MNQANKVQPKPEQPPISGVLKTSTQHKKVVSKEATGLHKNSGQKDHKGAR
jgi:hypothetical protein